MSADFLENHYFRAFVQEDMQTDGMGLGMSMARRIIHAMEAQIDVKSHQTGGGTQVTVTVPLERNHEPVAQEENGNTALQGSFAGVKVGIISAELLPFVEIQPQSE